MSETRLATWDEVALPEGTDKASSGHGYMAEYERWLGARPVRSVLEIGVETGASLRAWASIFPSAEIVGVDIEPGCARHAGGRIEVVIGDAGDRAAMAPLLRRSFDLIIDDGSHRLSDVTRALLVFGRCLSIRGVYIVEDCIIGPSRWPASLTDVVASLSMVELLPFAMARSEVPFIQSNVEWGRFAAVLADRP